MSAALAGLEGVSCVGEADLHNAVLEHPTVSVAISYLCRADTGVAASRLIDHVASLPSFPGISVRDLIVAAGAAGLELRGAKADLSELATLPLPFLTFLHRGRGGRRGLDLFRIERLGRVHSVIANDRFGTLRMPLAELAERWTGIVLMEAANHAAATDGGELQAYKRQIGIFDDLLTAEQCQELVRYCEEACFRRSRVGARVGQGREEVVSASVRNSSSVGLDDRRHPLLSRLYEWCASREHASPDDVEQIQCVRYKGGQRFKAHYDGGLGLPRLTTYLLYLSDDFTGGETYFPLLDYAVSPKAGRCLRFPSCDRSGRVLWPSLHGGLPVQGGVKYALNIWVRCSSRQSG